MANSLPALAWGLIVLLAACQPVTSSADAAAENPSGADVLELTVDGKSVRLTNGGGEDEMLVSANFVDGSVFQLSGMSKQQNVQFALMCYTGPLRAGGVYRVYGCQLPSECDKEPDKQNETVLYGPYPNGSINVADSRSAYNAPTLGLTPLVLRIKAVQDEAQPGNPWKTQRVTGEFEGKLAAVEKVGADWRIVGRPTAVGGKFSLLCSVR